ncbi:MAG TPA: glycosyltransferase family 4 protein [Polyangiaceae bacterium]|jgi:glycosyltransferase involved in cell wall biosynthesis
MGKEGRSRVVHVVVGGEIGGAERMLADLASSEASGAEHTIAVLSPLDELVRLFERAGVRVVDRGRVREGPAHYLWRSLGPGDVAWLTDVMRSARADIAHLHTFGSQVLGTRAARRAGLRVLRTEHSTRVYDDPSCWPFSRWSLARADAAVAVSEYLRGVATRRAPWATSKLRVVHNGVDVSRFAWVERLPRETFNFALVGRLEPRKGVDLALHALAAVPDARLAIVGDGDQRASLEGKARALGVAERVRFHGAERDVRGALADADAMLCSSRSEGLGVALLEGMATGLPVVGFSVGGVPEIVSDGVTGLLAASGDVDSLAARMRDATRAKDRMRALGAEARRSVVERFSVQAMCEGYARAYAEVLAR